MCRDTVFKLNHALTIWIFPDNIAIEDAVVIGDMGRCPQSAVVAIQDAGFRSNWWLEPLKSEWFP